MATRRYSINPQERMDQITEAIGAAVATKNIEVTVDFGGLAGLTPTMTGNQAKMHVINGLEKIIEYISKGNWPPA